MPYVNQRWLGGMLTNFKTIRASRSSGWETLRKMHRCQRARIEKRGKKEATMLRREMIKLEKSWAASRN